MPNLFYSLDCNNFIRAVGDNTPVPSLTFQYGTTPTVNVSLVSNNSLTVLPSGFNLVLGFKALGTYQTGNYVAYSSTNTYPDTGNGSYVYQFQPSFFNPLVSGLIGGQASVTLGCQLEYDLIGTNIGMSPVIPTALNASIVNLTQSDFNPGTFPIGGSTAFLVGSYTFTGASLYYATGNAPSLIDYLLVTAGEYTGNYVLSGQSGLNQVVKANIAFPVSGYQVINVYNGAPTGTPIYFFSGDGTATNFFFEAIFTGNSFQVLNAGYVIPPNTDFRIL